MDKKKKPAMVHKTIRLDPDRVDDIEAEFEELSHGVRWIIEKYYNEKDPTPWCHICGAMTSRRCDCGPVAENN